MGKLLLTGVDGNLGETAAEILLTLEPKENLIFLCGEEGICLYLNENIGRAEDESCSSVFLFR